MAGTISLYKNAGIITEKSEAGTQVHAAFSKFMLFNIEHMAKEEDVLNPILWRYYTDAELMAISQQIIAKHSAGLCDAIQQVDDERTE